MIRKRCHACNRLYVCNLTDRIDVCPACYYGRSYLDLRTVRGWVDLGWIMIVAFAAWEISRL